MIRKLRHDSLAVLDVGSSKMACFIARLEGAGKLRITGIGHQLSQGIKAGVVVDTKAAETAILSAVSAAEKMAGETIDRIAISVGGRSLGSQTIHIETKISGNEVTEHDMEDILAEGYRHIDSKERRILHALPVEYRIDEARGIKDPRGMFGETLYTALHLISVANGTLRNLTQCMARCRLDMEECVAAPYASGLASLTRDEKELGAVAIDIGAETTSISVFLSGHAVYVDVMPVGGAHITRDIASGLATNLAFAERIKTLYGTVLSTNADEREMLDIPQGEEGNSTVPEVQAVSKATLIAILRPRIEEILEMVRANLEDSGYWNVGRRFVLTGGGSQMTGLKELASYMFAKQVRIGRPPALEGLAEATKGPTFAAAIGMLLYLMEEDYLRHSLVELGSKEGIFRRIFRWAS